MGKRSTGRPEPPEVVLYIEGDDALRLSFQTLFSPWREGLRPRFRFKVVMGDSNNETADKWRIAGGQARDHDTVLLLIDSEGPVPEAPSDVPPGCSSFLTSDDVNTERVFLMVQLMEAWFLTRPDTLAGIYGKGFDAAKLPVIPTHSSPPCPGQHLEAVSKESVIDGLSKATRETRKGAYNRANAKTTVAPRMLDNLDLAQIGQVSFHAERLRRCLESL